jgi:hypothetical protein
MMLAVLLGAALAVSCTRDDPNVAQRGDGSQATTVDPTTSADRTKQQNVPTNRDIPTSRIGGSATPAAAGVELLEYQIRLPQSVAAGKQTFSVSNAGKEQHGFEIEGNGVHLATQKLSRGDTTQLAVDLKPGTYTVYCPVEGHKEKGMTATLTVNQ